MNNQTQRNKISQDKMNITHHAYMRFIERVKEQGTTERELRKLAFSARYNGLNIRHLKLSQVNYNKKLYDYLTNYFRFRNNSDDIRFYDKYIFVYTGKKSRTLRTIINVNEKLLLA